MLWFDGGWGRGQYDPYKRELLAYYYNQAEAAGKQVAVAKKGEDLPEGVGVLNFERGRAEGILKRPWETDTSVYQNSWGYINDIKYYTADYLVDELIDIVSKNGVMLLNVGPRADGTIPEQARQILLDMGKWLEVNGERVQNGSTQTMVYGVAHLISYLSQFFTLHPGDIISTGTPPGVGLGFAPPRYLSVGDQVVLGIQGLGEQEQVCVADE
jgi:alpha-L-fucosidase